MSPTLGESQSRADNFGDRQFVVIASEKQARVVALPSQTCVYRQQIADTDFVVKAETISVKGTKTVSVLLSLNTFSLFQIVYVWFVMFLMDIW